MWQDKSWIMEKVRGEERNVMSELNRSGIFFGGMRQYRHFCRFPLMFFAKKYFGILPNQYG